MADYPELFRDMLKERGALAELGVTGSGKKYVDITVENRSYTAFFNGSGNDYLSIRYQHKNVPFEKKGEVILLCNELNSRFKFVKIYIDEDNDIMMCIDLRLTEEDAMETAYDAFIKMVIYIERNKEKIRDVIYS